MTNKYVPTGTPVTPYERELLTILMEEAAEVIVAASKLLRFGAGDKYPETGMENSDQLALEIGHFFCMADMALESDLISEAVVSEGSVNKRHKLKTYMTNDPPEPSGDREPVGSQDGLGNVGG